MGQVEKISRFVGRHLSDVHAQNVICLPVFASLEVTRGHLTSAQSLDARVAAYASGLAGVGFLYARGNDLARKVGAHMGFSSGNAEKVIDTVYGATFFYGYSLALYAFASKMKVSDAQAAALSASVTGVLIGSPLGYCTNLWRDAFNIENKYGKPTFLRGASLKKRLATVALSASLALGIAGGAYTLKNHYQPPQHTTLEQVVTAPQSR